LLSDPRIASDTTPVKTLQLEKNGLSQDIHGTKTRIHGFFTIKLQNNNIFHPYSILIDRKIPKVFETYESRIYKYTFQNLFL